MIYSYHKNGSEPPIVAHNPWIFVFGSNLAGVHGAGAALHARKYYGARNGVGWGQEGRSFAFPTKDERIQTLTLNRISGYAAMARKYMEHRITNAEQRYWFTAVGTGLAGYQHSEIAPLFKDFGRSVLISKPYVLSDFVSFPEEWQPFLEPDHQT